MLLLIFLLGFVSSTIVPLKRGSTKDKRKLDSHSDFLYGNSTDIQYYFVEMEFGTPPTKQTLIVDTGSSITTIPCENLCEHCGNHLNKKYSVESAVLSRIFDWNQNELFFNRMSPFQQPQLQLKQTVFLPNSAYLSSLTAKGPLTKE